MFTEKNMLQGYISLRSGDVNPPTTVSPYTNTHMDIFVINHTKHSPLDIGCQVSIDNHPGTN